MKKNISNIVILGSTGSIGRQTLDIIRNHPDHFNVLGLAAGSNTTLLERQICEFSPSYFYAAQEIPVQQDTCHISMEEMACLPDADLIVTATSGKAGLSPTLKAIRSGKRIAIANKEVLVMAGQIITGMVTQYGATLLPIDSEHSAIWQCLNGESAEISRIILTASGGPFYQFSQSALATITVSEALNHPTWQMGKKVTIDSATLMNKGLETIEAHWLFNVPFDKIEIVVHPKSIVHSMVEFIDGSIKAQLSLPDMRIPIQFALSYPHRLPGSYVPKLNFDSTSQLTFEKVDYSRFPCLKLAIEAGRKGGTYPAVLCAADEVAVDLFLEERIGFTDISEIIERTLELHHNITDPSLEEILEADRWAQETVKQIAIKEK